MTTSALTAAAKGTGFDLEGRRVIITGASRGIGKGLAQGFAQAGAHLALVARTPSALEEVRDELTNQCGARVSIHACDIRDVSAVTATVAEIAASGYIDALVNNAGLNIRTKAVDVTEEEWQTIIDTDLRGAFFMAQQVGKQMIARGSGSIINVSSVGGHVALRTGVVYAAAKAGVIQMTKVLAMEWGKHNVRVNGIAPWYFRTPLTEKLLDNPEYLGEIVARTPLGRVGDVSELVGPSVFLASDAASYITGHTLFVDGGMSIYGF